VLRQRLAALVVLAPTKIVCVALPVRPVVLSKSTSVVRVGTKAATRVHVAP